MKLDASGSRLIYAAYLGGNGPDAISGIAIDGEGNAVVAGVTASSNFPTVRPWQAALGGPIDAFAAKINPQGTELLYSTYIGGSATDLASAVAVDAAGSAYVAGYTQSATIPAAPSPTLPGFQRNRAGDSDAFACKLDRDGRPVYATLLGGAAGEQAFGAAVSANGELIVTGVTHSENFPTANALIGSTRAAENVFVTKLTRDGTGLVYSTFLNGDGGGDGLAVAADAAGAAYVTGMAMAGFPTVNPAAPCTAAQAFVAKLSPDGTRLEYSTCLGGTNTSIGRAVVVDAAGNAYVAGLTDSGDFPLVDAVQQRIGSDVLFKTNDGGGTWTPAGDGLLNLNITSLLVDPYTSSTLYALTAGGGIAKSTNGAATWQRVNTGLNQEMICGLAMGGPSTLYTSSDLTLYKTTDGAASWQPGAAGIGCVLAASPRAPDLIFASGQPGLLKSVDGGRTFSPAGVGIPAQAYVGVLVIDPSNPEVLYAGTSGHGAFKSTDGGATFSAMNVDSNVFALAVAPSASNIVYAGARFGVYTSKDGGRTWDMPLSAVFDCVYALAVDPGNPSIVYAGTREGGIAKSTNGGTSFSDASDGVSSPRIWTVAIDPSDTSRVYAGAVARDDAFVTKLNASGSRVLLSTFLGGHGNDEAAGLALDSGGAIYVAGTTDSGDLPLVSPRHSKLDDSTDAFLARIDPGGGVAQVACTSGASFAPSAPVAANSIASLWGKELAPSAASAGSLPLPVELAGARVRVIDFSGVERFAPLFFVSPGQINFLVPEGTRPGTASLAAIRDGAIVGMGTVEIAEIAPALFTANSSGRGVPAATAVRVSATGVQTPVRVYDCPSGGGSCMPVPLDVGGPTDQLVLVLYGTGIRGRSAGGAVTAVVGGTPAMVLYAGPQADVGVDQVNVAVPRALAGRGEAPLQLSVDGKAANAVTIVVR